MGCASILLAAIVGFGLSQPGKESLRRERTATVLQKIEEGLREYRIRNHSFPENNAIDLGAAVLFQALTEDQDGDGLPDSKDLILVRESVPPLDPASGKVIGNAFVSRTNGQWMIVDAWGMRIYYMNFKAGDPLHPQGGGKYNSTYDVWSIGNSDGTNIDRWIKNW